MKWSILTPDDSVTWDGPEAAGPRFGPGVPASDAPQPDALEDLWRAYYASTFNPARTNLRAMKREVPVRHWATLPEMHILPDLLRDAPRRVEEMMATAKRNVSVMKEASVPVDPNCKSTGSAADFLPERLELPLLQTASKACRGCDLYCKGTQTVFGEGPADATVMFVGEQPGDQEDRAGRPFVGPAGQMLDSALQEAGVPRDECYVTNAVKHFKWEPRGKRRIHSKPSAREINACKPWLEAEIKVLNPKVIVCLGATAAQDLLGRDFRLTQHRGEPIKGTPWAPWVLATVHPSALLRMPDEAAREQARAQFVDDMRLVAKQIKSLKR